MSFTLGKITPVLMVEAIEPCLHSGSDSVSCGWPRYRRETGSDS